MVCVLHNPIYFNQHSVTFRYNWHQYGKPYTDYTPFRGGVRASAGCSPVAIGMIMAWHQWPLQGAYPRYESINSTVPKNYYPEYKEETWALFHPYDFRDEVSPTDPRVREHIANLLAEIGYKLNASYNSSTDTQAAPDWTAELLQRMGYYCKSMQNETFDATIILNDIKLKRPVYMAGNKAVSGDDKSGGHAYVVSAVMTRGKWVGSTSTDTGEPMQIFIKNGGAGSGDGWFNVELFEENKGPTTTEDGRTEGTFVYKYRFRCKMMTGIRPNYNNIGSKTMWRFSTRNPY